MDSTESSAPHAHPSTEDHDTVEAHYSGLEHLRPHTCRFLTLASSLTAAR
jgi:hypothetical protein